MGSASANCTAEFAQGRVQLSKRWKSWSAQSTYGIPLGSKTAREAARSFWNRDMLQQRLEKILEYASQEASSMDNCDAKELKDLDDDYISRSERDDQTTTVHVIISDDDDCASTTDDDETLNSNFAPASIPSPGSEMTAEVCNVGQSALQSMHSNSGETYRDRSLNFTVRSAPILDERHTETFPITAMLSQSAHTICCN